MGSAACSELAQGCTPCSIEAPPRSGAQRGLPPVVSTAAARGVASSASQALKKNAAVLPGNACTAASPADGHVESCASNATPRASHWRSASPALSSPQNTPAAVAEVNVALAAAMQLDTFLPGSSAAACLPLAKEPLPAAAGHQAPCEGGLEEPEPAPEALEAAEDAPEPECDVVRERIKSAVVAAAVVAIWALTFGTLSLISKDFQEPVCPEDTGHLKVCAPCAGGTYVVPVFGEWEKALPNPLLAVIYFLGLMWTFLGIGVVCDQFMGAIEVITSAERIEWRVIHDGAKHKFHVKVWNATVANLTLMALGSSAPEILLSVIEICTRDFFAGALGPSTIVGSAAFNLLVITAVCICAIPAPETRKVEGIGVFAVTATFSIFAYAWLLVILVLNSPDLVEVWEASVTLCMFPTLIVIAFVVDKGLWRRCCPGHEVSLAVQNRRLSWIEKETQGIEARYGRELPAETLAFLLQQRSESSTKSVPSRARIRASMMRGVLGSKARGGKDCCVGFEEPETTVLECAGTIQLRVLASRAPGRRMEVAYCTEDGTAREGTRYHRSEGVLTFEPSQTERTVEVQVIDDETWQSEEYFVVKLQEPVPVGSEKASLPLLRLGTATTKVMVLNDDMPGTLSFDVDETYTHEGRHVTLGIVRTQGTTGQISCKYMTVDGTAIAGRDFELDSGTVVFEDGEMLKTIQVPILQSDLHHLETEERFRVVLCNPSPGVRFGGTTDENGTRAYCEVVITGGKQSSWKARILRSLLNQDLFMQHLSEWSDQLGGAFYCNGDAEEQAKADFLNWFFHAASLPWKVLFALVPPPCFNGGWLCFVGALVMIAVVTVIVSELASSLGCCMGIGDDITAITLVALGTSLPDTFASKLAAQQDPTADNSIGNVTGSNSVNVFLGLGLPWSIAALYWDSLGPTEKWRSHVYQGQTYHERFGREYPQGGFLVPAGALAFSVSVFTGCALLCIALLAVRRVAYGGELGGPRCAQLRDAGILVLLWLGYITASCIMSVYAE